MAALLDPTQMERYSRQIRLPQVGVTGQSKLLQSKVLVVGAGALGSAAAIYLAAAGVGCIGLVDGDAVELSNLGRQVLHFDRDQGRPKTQSGRRHLEDLNPNVQVIEHRLYLRSENAPAILGDYDVILNGTDNFPTRYLLSDACVLLRKPLVDASILTWEAQATTFLPGQGCYRCLYPSPPPPGSVPSCAEAGVIGAMAGHLGTLQALEAIKVLLGVGEPLVGRLLVYDALAADWHTFKYRRKPDCPACGDHPSITALIDYEDFCGVPAPRPAAPPAVAAGQAELAPPAVASLLAAGSADLIDVRSPGEYARGHIGGSRLIPAGQINGRLAELSRERTVVLVCNVGDLSGMVTGVLRDAGYSNAYNLTGGIAGWQNQGLPLAEGEPA